MATTRNLRARDSQAARGYAIHGSRGEAHTRARPTRSQGPERHKGDQCCNLHLRWRCGQVVVLVRRSNRPLPRAARSRDLCPIIMAGQSWQRGTFSKPYPRSPPAVRGAAPSPCSIIRLWRATLKQRTGRAAAAHSSSPSAHAEARLPGGSGPKPAIVRADMHTRGPPAAALSPDGGAYPEQKALARECNLWPASAASDAAGHACGAPRRSPLQGRTWP